MAQVGRLRGLSSQRMSVKRGGQQILKYFSSTTAGAGVATAPNAKCQVDAFLWGGGGGAPLQASGGGGGGEAVYKRFICAPFQQIPYSVGFGGQNGNPSDSSSITLVSGIVIKANGGLAPNGSLGGAGGTGGNGDINRTGGAGGNAAANGFSGTNGAAGGATDGTNGGGGGSGGFNDLGDLLGGVGGPATTGGLTPGGGSGGAAGTPRGGNGQVLMIFTRLRD